jgi:hypothetical protein
MRIQVKASRNGCNRLVGQVRPEPTLIYCLVDFEGGDTGTVYVVPSQTVLDATDAFHRCFEDRNLRETPIRNPMDPWRISALDERPDGRGLDQLVLAEERHGLAGGFHGVAG